MKIMLQYKLKSNNYTESCMINEADGWRGGNVWYALKEVTIAISNAERTEVSRGHSSQEMKGRISRSLLEKLGASLNMGDVKGNCGVKFFMRKWKELGRDISGEI